MFLIGVISICWKKLLIVLLYIHVVLKLCSYLLSIVKNIKNLWALCLASRLFLRIYARTPSISIYCSPFSWKILCSTEHAIIWSETFAICVSILFRRQRHLALRMPNAISATTRAKLTLRLKTFFTPVSAGPCG